MKIFKKAVISCILGVLTIFLMPEPSNGQTEVMAWSNITGIRVNGQLMEFESSIRVVEKGWQHIDATGKERRRTFYDRQDDSQKVTSSIGGIDFTELVKENGKGSAIVTIQLTAVKDTLVEGTFFCIELPEVHFGKSTLIFTGGTKRSVKLAELKEADNQKPIVVKAKGCRVESSLRTFEILFDSESSITIRKESNISGILLYIGLAGSSLPKGQQVKKTFTIKAGGVIDNTLAEITFDPFNPGAKFEGVGGNFRLQNAKLDPPVIQYCLDNMNVSWGRVEMPWALWQPVENSDPAEAAKKGNLNQHVRESMEMAQKLAGLGIPMIISDWDAPDWAIIGDPRDAYRYRSKGIYGYQLNAEKLEKIYKSIGDYLVYLKQHYGVEPALFSFNESDLGINIRHTGKEHADFIKGIGAHFAARGIATKLLLGDNSDATTFDFILPAMADPGTHKYIGAISFHSWRGCDDATLKKWAGAAKQMNLPLIVAEGSTDAAAWNYPEIFYEQPFALYEINLYTRLCSLCQPLTILQWQLTADYSVLAGKDVFGTTGPLRPTRRFWNLKQLASTPTHAFSLPVTCNIEVLNCAAFGNNATGEYAIHIVNNGAARTARVTGFPKGIGKVKVYVTDEMKGMEKTGELEVTDGTIQLELLPTAFITLIAKK
jgi:hypothetical protein